MGSMPRIVLTVLGSGTSHGVPMIGCACAVCKSNDPHDKRTRCSVFVEWGAARILVDTTPELRLQCIAHGVGEIDAILFTHHHADHVVGLDDVRRFNWLMQRKVSVYGMPATLAGIRRMFSYAFEADAGSPHSRPALAPIEVEREAFEINGVSVVPIPMIHGHMPVLGFRFGPIAYCTDCSEIPPSSMELLQDLEVLVLDALRKRPHPAHLNLEQAVKVASQVKARQTFFTHIAHELPHAATNAELPAGMALAYDGLRIVVGK